MGELAIAKDRNTLQALLSHEKVQASLRDVIPKHLTAERICKMALVACSRAPKLFQCTQESLLKAVMSSAELGLDCSGALGAAYLVPYRNGRTGQYEAQFIAGYRGLIDLARRSGKIVSLSAHVVYEQDAFDVAFGTAETITHKPYLGADAKRGKENIICVYAVAKLTDGTTQTEVMTLGDIEGIRKRSKAGQDGPWVTDYAEMARKTVVRRLCKYLPLSPEMEKALIADEELEPVGITHRIRSTPATSGNGADALAKRLTAAQEDLGLDEQTEMQPDPSEDPPADVVSEPDASEQPQEPVESVNTTIEALKAQNGIGRFTVECEVGQGKSPAGTCKVFRGPHILTVAWDKPAAAKKALLLTIERSRVTDAWRVVSAEAIE